MSQLELAKARARIARARSAQPPAPVASPALQPVSGILQTTGPGPTGRIDPALYEMGAIGRRFAEGPAAVPETRAGLDVPMAFGSGLVRGTTSLMDVPGMIGGAMIGGAEMLGLPKPVADVSRAFVGRTWGTGDKMGQTADAMLPGVRQYEPQTTLGDYAQTVGEFLPATAGSGGAGAIMGGVVPAIASEAAGQATEGTPWEPAARIIGAVGAPIALNSLSKGLRSMFAASQAKPTIENLRATKTAAYRAVDDAGEVFQPAEITKLRDRVLTALDDANYVPGVDAQTDAVLKVLEKRTTEPTTLSQLDRVRQNLWKRYSSAPNETGILDAIDEIDNLVASRASSNELMQAARLANARYKKAELLDIALRKAADQTASTGSGGNILNKYRQAVTSIINNPKQAKWFAPEEIEAMRNFVRGSFGENALRRFGKLAPGGNGLMLALNLGATAINPAMLAVTAAASGAKAVADSSATTRAMSLMDMAAGARPATPPPSNLRGTLAPLASSVLNQ